MKKSTRTIINILLLTFLILTIATVSVISKELNELIKDKNELQILIESILKYPNYLYPVDLTYHLAKLDELDKLISKHGIWLTIHLVTTLTALSALALVNSFIFKKSTYTKNKTERAQAKALKAEADKQAKIAKLEQQLEELKKD